MARYSALIGRRIEVHYHAGETVLPATGTLAADSGRSIFLEESVRQRGVIQTFRWEIPYDHIVRLTESAMPAPVPVSAAGPVPTPVRTTPAGPAPVAFNAK